MPTRIKCKKCGGIISKSEDLECPADVVDRLGMKCSKCGRKIKFKDIDNLEVDVKGLKPLRASDFPLIRGTPRVVVLNRKRSELREPYLWVEKKPRSKRD